MNLQNTNSSQDREIQNAIFGNPITNLVDIIKDLDAQISEWKDVADKFGCSTPEELGKKLSEL